MGSEAGSPWRKRPKAPRPDAAAKREQLRKRKRQAVLDAAVRAFNENGFSATSLEDVAKALSVTKPTIYHYFADKDEILFECVRLGSEGIREAITRAEAGGGSGLERLTAILLDYAAIIMRDFGRCVALTSDHEMSEASRLRFRTLKREIDDALRRVVEAGMADGSLRRGDPRLVTFTLTGALNWVSRWYDPAGSLTSEEVAQGCVQTLLNGVAANPETKAQ